MGSKLWLEILDPALWGRISSIFVDQNSKFLEYKNSGHEWAPAVSISSRDLYRSYSTTINLRYESFRYAWGPWWNDVPTRIGTCAWPLGFLYTHRAPWIGQDPLMHERERNFQVMSAYPVFKGAELHWQTKTLPRLKILGEESVRNLQSKGLRPGKYVLINPTASRRFKAWPAEQFSKLVQNLLAKNISVRVIGTPSETEWLREVCGDETLWLQPKSIFELMDYVAHARLLVANASSMHFIAASFQTPCLVLMGAAKPEVWAPLGDKSFYLKGQTSSGKKGPRLEQAAFATIAQAQVLQKVEQILSRFAEDST